jgi:DNA-binding NarL/FixJ family response regulator
MVSTIIYPNPLGMKRSYSFLKNFLNNEVPVRRHNIHHQDIPFTTLAPRELEILHYILKGIGTKEISETLNLKMNTVSTIKNRIYEKTTAGNIKELMELGDTLQCKLLIRELYSLVLYLINSYF